MRSNSSQEISRVERDPDLFVWFMTFVVGIMYVVTVINTPAVRQSARFLIFTGLIIIHTILHWQLGRIIEQPRKVTWYIFFQGVLVFVILLAANNLGMLFALYMGLIGEAIGVFGLTRKGLLSAIYFLALMSFSLLLLSGWTQFGPLMLGTIPMLIFVTLFVTLYMRQTEAREHAQKLASELETANLQLAEYAVQLEELTLAAERQRLARELHDILSQGVAGLVLQLEAIKAHHEAGRGERVAEIIDQSLARARSTLADSRSAIDDLRAIPASLPEAIRARTERFTQATGIHCELSLSLGDTVFSPHTGEHLLRVLNEALANVTRHAQADQVWVSLGVNDDQFDLEIRDNGRGFDPELEKAAGHYGLLGMRERARLVGGTLEIDSGSGAGTRIRLFGPLLQKEPIS